MRRTAFIFISVVAIAVVMTGCKKKQQALEELQQPMSPEELSRLATQSQNPKDAQPPVPEAGANVVGQDTAVPPAANVQKPAQTATPAPVLGQLPPAGPYKPATLEIQTALKNAGFYNGTLDGKVGEMTKKAVQEFQKANGLEADGKVGPKTWVALSKYLNPVPAETKSGKKKKK